MNIITRFRTNPIPFLVGAAIVDHLCIVAILLYLLLR
jgi:hypothetical protein